MSIKQPKNVKTTCGTLVWKSSFGSDYTERFNKAQQFIDSECLRKMDPLTPADTTQMIQSASRGTKIGSGLIQYDSPYARRQYYENQGGSPKHPQATHHWFERMKAQYKDEILRGAQKYVSGH